MYDACVEFGFRQEPRGSLFVGVDASVRRDSTACVAIRYDDQSDRLVLADHKIWKPTPGQPINLESSVEFYLRRIYNQPGTEIVKDSHRSVSDGKERANACGGGSAG